jgi:hypothetical protein
MDLLAVRKTGVARSPVPYAGAPCIREARNRVDRMSVGVAIAVGAVIGLALGILVAVIADVPLAPEIGLVLGALVGWLMSREGRPVEKGN